MKTYIIDTNVILDSVDNIYKLSDNGANLIVIPEVVIDELDSKKSGFEEINFNARQFARLLEEGVITGNLPFGKISGFYITLSNPTVNIVLLTKQSYECEDGKPIAVNIMNDRKILELARDYSEQYDNTSQFISLDVMCRTRALTLGLKTDFLHGKDKALNFQFHKTVELTDSFNTFNNIDILSVSPDHKPENYSYTLVEKDTNRHFLGTIQNTKFVPLDDKLNNRTIKALNKEQLFFLSALLDPHYNLVACEAKAGSGL